jgi:hypothetical protein
MYIEKATAYWNNFVLTGVSPEYDEKKDADILKELRTNCVEPEVSVEALVAEGELLKAEIKTAMDSVAEANARLKQINETLKEFLKGSFRDGDNAVTIQGKKYLWSYSKSESVEIDKDALIADGLLDKYSKTKTNYRLTTSEIKEEK